jgi:hypothetical protein
MTMAVEQESEAMVQPTVADLHVVQRDDGKYQLGIHDDAPGPFESRAFAQAVVDQQQVSSRIDLGGNVTGIVTSGGRR